VVAKDIGLPRNFLLVKQELPLRKNLISFAAAATIAWPPGCLFGAPQVSTLAQLLVEEGYTPLTLKRAGNQFYVSCKLNGRSASLVVDTGAGQTVISSAMLRSLRLPLTKGEENVYGMMGLAGKNIKAGEIKDFQVGPYQAGAHPVSAWDFSYFGSALRGSSMDGLLGIDFLNRHQAIIDCFRMHLFLKSPSAPSASATLSAGLRAGGLHGNSNEACKSPWIDCSRSNKRALRLSGRRHGRCAYPA